MVGTDERRKRRNPLSSSFFLSFTQLDNYHTNHFQQGLVLFDAPAGIGLKKGGIKEEEEKEGAANNDKKPLYTYFSLWKAETVRVG